jgi:hypothetical protein
MISCEDATSKGPQSAGQLSNSVARAARRAGTRWFATPNRGELAMIPLASKACQPHKIRNFRAATRGKPGQPGDDRQPHQHEGKGGYKEDYHAFRGKGKPAFSAADAERASPATGPVVIRSARAEGGERSVGRTILSVKSVNDGQDGPSHEQMASLPTDRPVL